MCVEKIDRYRYILHGKTDKTYTKTYISFIIDHAEEK